jgi:regulator of protease activity HflC (stomatin/prohibitin superfamily)
MWIEQLVSAIIRFSSILSPLVWVNAGDGGVILRWGKFKCSVTPGIIFKWPIMDVLHDTSVVVSTLNLPSQSLTTLDDKPVVVAAVVKYSIENTEYYYTRVYDAKDAIQDVVMGHIADAVEDREYKALRFFLRKVVPLASEEVAYWGVKIHRITRTDRQRCRSIRLLQDYVLKSTE